MAAHELLDALLEAERGDIEAELLEYEQDLAPVRAPDSDHKGATEAY